jgi:hypothetical protein
LTSLQFALTDATSILAPLATTGVETLDLTKPMTVYADVFASSPSGAGLYLLTASFVPSTAVPLPSSIASLAGALLILLLGLSDRSRAAVRAFAQATVITSMA